MTDTVLKSEIVAPFACPKCGSDNTQRLSVIFRSGTTQTTSSGSHTGVAMSGGKFVPVVGSTKTQGVQQTQLAAIAAPPAKRQEFGLVAMIATIVLSPVIGLIVFIIIAAATKGEIGAALCFLATPILLSVGAVTAFVTNRKNKAWNRDVLPAEYALWEKKFLCHRCGETFDPAAPGDSASDARNDGPASSRRASR